jgi:hypothetical protein
MGNIHIKVKMTVSFWFFMPHSELCLLQPSEESWKETSEENKTQRSLQLRQQTEISVTLSIFVSIF